MAKTNWKSSYFRYKDFFLNIYKLYREKPSVKMFPEILLSLIAISSFSLFALKPTILTILNLNKQIKTKEETIDQMDTKIANLAKAQNIYSQETKRISLLDTALPIDPLLEDAVRQIQGFAQKSNVAITSLSSKMIALKGQDTESVNKDILLPEKSKGVALTLSASGEYPALFDFINNLEKLRRPALISSVNFSRDNSQKNSNNLYLNLGLEAPYFLKE